MLNTFVPLHQFEIRYTGILNFASIKNVVSPFVKFTSRIFVENENSFLERIILHFDDQFFQIVVSWDKILIRVEVDDFESLLENNSKVEEPFFNLFEKITKINDFGEIGRVFSYLIFVNPLNDSYETVVKKFSQKHFTSAVLGTYTDIGLKFSKEENNYIHQVTFGPYSGIQDLRKLNIEIRNPELYRKSDIIGEYILCNSFETVKSGTFNFKKYKSILSSQIQLSSLLWKQ